MKDNEECKDHYARRQQMETKISKLEDQEQHYTMTTEEYVDWFLVPNGGCGIPLAECSGTMPDLGTLPASGNLDDVFVGYPKEFTCTLEGVTVEDLYGENDIVTLIGKVVRWHHDRNLIDGSTDKDQTLKLLQELGELSDSVCKGKDIRDDIGDMLVVMLNIAERNRVSLGECLERAWQDIKDRKGKMVDGIFVKEADL